MSISEFARVKGISRQGLYKAIGRGDVRVDGTSIDADDPVNLGFHVGQRPPPKPKSERKRRPKRETPIQPVVRTTLPKIEPEVHGSPVAEQFQEASRWLTPDEAAALVGKTEEDLATDPIMAREFRRHAAMEERLAWKIISAPMHGLEQIENEGKTLDVDDRLVSVATNFIRLRRMPRQPFFQGRSTGDTSLSEGMGSVYGALCPVPAAQIA